ncbi:uncharacterized protein EV154DRAFT_514014 [Mucor mucedo]|uniref:uncharacterized protein n=1 Tax=Mucor mucedo TaxID=29922 RepID=UPI00221FF811|nr:uncharacterized protein EV154DRAFT_514014 [Mucor mucedo]KAI7889642.1 hypothetical protein EV154DRAFT_514014 [Mucor mucedo]
MSYSNGGDQPHNPWSLDYNQIVATERSNDAEIQHIQYQAQQLKMQFDHEMDALRLSSVEQLRQSNMNHQTQIDSMRKEVEERESRLETIHLQQFENLKIFYDRQLAQQKEFYEQLTTKIDERTEKLEDRVSKLQHSLEIAHQQQNRNEATIVLLETQLKEMTTRSEDLYERAEGLNREVDNLQLTCDTLRAENRKLNEQIKLGFPITEDAIVTRTDIERATQASTPFSKEKIVGEYHRGNESSHLEQHSISTHGSRMEEDVKSERFESVNNSWDNQSVGSATPSVVSQARHLATMASANRVNTGRASVVRNTQSRNKHPTPAFYGTNKPTSQEWLSQFRKVILYHQYNNEECLAEFMMAMQGHANSWWEAQPDTVTKNFEALIIAFEKFYGGSKASMARSIATLKTLAQNKESMATFGPRIMNLISTVAQGNEELKLSFFYSAVDSKVADTVMSTRPSSLVEAVNVAIELEQGLLYKNGSSAHRTAPTTKVDWAPMTSENGVDMMDVDVNAQYRHRSSNHKDKNSSGLKCHVCDKSNHVMKDCFVLRDAKAMAKEKQDNKKDKSHHSKKKSKEPTKSSHAQQAVPIASKDIST